MSKEKEPSDLQKLPEALGVYGWMEIAPLFFAAWVAGLPCVLIGPPGSSKTTFVTRFSRALALKTETLDLPYLTSTRLLGIPNPDQLKHGKLVYIGGLIDTKPEVVILDELTRCHPSTQSLVLEFLREGRLDQHYLRCKRVATANPPAGDLVGVSHLDMAQATRIVHCEVPSLAASLIGQFIAEWNTTKTISQEVVDACNYVNDTPMELPPPGLMGSIAKQIAQGLAQYSLSGRQLDSIMRLLTASYNLEQRGLHSFSALDLGRLATAVIPIRLTKNKWSIEPQMLAHQLARHLTDFPWKQEQVEVYQTASVAVEAAQQKYQMATQSELLAACKQGGLEGFIAFEAFLKRIVTERDWDIPLDNFTKW
jgi:hypothetical protein